jgi:4-amino-4-deoxy-L-arabinose transferase-like glycosyltransferase
MVRNIEKLIRESIQIILIVVAATLLRVWRLSTHAILFGDAGHDILSAITALQTKTIPFLGIASSVPRFHQGPLTVWAHMLILLIPGRSVFYHSLFFAMISIAAVVLIYEFAAVHRTKFEGLVAAALLAFSPLAVAHGRMAYHITPLPLAMILFLFAAVYMAKGGKRGIFWASLAWAFVFQFELATAPLILVVVYLLAKKKKLFSRYSVRDIVAGAAIGLLPQIIFDLTNNFKHLGGFVLWVGYRLVSSVTVGSHRISTNSLTTVFSTFKIYFGKMISTDVTIITVIFIAAIFLSGYLLISQFKQQKLPVSMEVVGLSTLILIVSFIIHGGPSEAYFPPFLVLLPLLLAYALTQIHPLLKRIVVVSLFFLAAFNSWSIFQHNFFVSTIGQFNYGYSVAEQRNIVSYIKLSTDSDFQFKTTTDVFPSYFDNLRVMAWEQDLNENTDNGNSVFIETKKSPLRWYPDVTRAEFKTVDVYQLL